MAVLAAASLGVSEAHARTVGPSRHAPAAFESSLLARINQVRSAHGLNGLQPSPALSAAAHEHDTQMIQFGYFDHLSPDGSAFWRRVASLYRPEPRRRWAVGENLLSASPGASPERALAAWLASPEHRAIILDTAWREIGLAVLRASSAPGVFGGQPTMVITADFGVRS